MFVVFVIDDFRDVSPPAKIAGQVLSGSVLSLFGVTMLYFRVPFASYEYVVLSADLAPLVTVVTVVVLANAINLIDGIDGLAVRRRAHRGGGDLPVRRSAVQGRPAGRLEHRTAGRRDHRRRVRGLPASQLQPGAHHHGRRGRDVARALPRDDDDHHRRTNHRPVQRSDLLLLRAAAHPVGDPRRADRRRRVLRSSVGWCAANTSRKPTASTCTTVWCAWATGRGARSSILWLWTALLSAVGAAPDVHRPGEHARARRQSSPSGCSSTSTSIPVSAAAGRRSRWRHEPATARSGGARPMRGRLGGRARPAPPEAG